jgi:hypothetical protein
MRLPTCIIAALLTFLGALMAGLTYSFKTQWAGPIIGLGVLSAGAQMGATLAISYSLDCHKEVCVLSAPFSDPKSHIYLGLKRTLAVCGDHGDDLMSQVTHCVDLDLVYQ